MTLLPIPLEKLKPGSVVKEGEKYQGRLFGQLSDILKPKYRHRPYSLPRFSTQNIAKRIRSSDISKIGIDIALKKLLQALIMIFSRLRLKLKGQFSRREFNASWYEFRNITSREIETAKLMNSVANYVFKPAFQLNYTNEHYYVVTEVWYCDSGKIEFLNRGQNSIQIEEESLASFGLDKGTDGKYEISFKKEAFAVKLMEFDYDAIWKKIIIKELESSYKLFQLHKSVPYAKIYR